MAGDPTRTEDNPSLEDILNALDDTDCREILKELRDPTTANEIVEARDIPQSTVYRKLEILCESGLVRGNDTINPGGGGRTTKYERDFTDVTISMDNDDELIVDIGRPRRKADEQLANIWSKMVDEL